MQPSSNANVPSNTFEGLISYAKSFPGVRFVTASEAYVICRDKAQGRAFSAAELAQVASQVKPGITFQVSSDYSLSASDTFYLLNSLVSGYVSNGAIGEVTLAGTPYGPASQAYGLTMPAGATKIGWSQFSRTSIDVSEFLTRRRSIPNAVWFGSTAVTPEAYLLALANVAQDLVSGGPAARFGDGFCPRSCRLSNGLPKILPRSGSGPSFRPDSTPTT